MGEAVDAAVQKLLKNPPVPFRLVTETLFKVVTNVVNNPSDPKYLELRRDSATYANKIAGCAGGLAYLKAVGFVPVDGVMRMQAPPDVDYLRACRAALKAAVREYNTALEARQREENEQAAQKLKELSDATRKRRANHDAEKVAEREAILKGMQIDRDERQRQLDPTNMK